MAHEFIDLLDLFDSPFFNHLEMMEEPETANSQTFQRPDYPGFTIEAVRLRTFKDWPKSMKQTPEQMSDAGFFYTQLSDRVICFSCGGGLRQWTETDIPWEQHAVWYSKCNYLQLMKGQEYIEQIKKKFDKNENDETNGDEPSPTTSSQQEDELNGNNGNSNCHSPPCQNENSDETTELNESRLCKICYVNEYNTVFLPCGHIIACAKCASSQTKCPMCRKPFETIARIFLP